ncbi:BON domain-containing protein [Granulicella cerasi]|uniref:BON domain-containing protein n=1 Tax=Granulicella cerasi TaxID=741063 RepID=A0ABW1Z4F1_9BACT|nr:BON domain-containing protein [Granulicella cerasi]
MFSTTTLQRTSAAVALSAAMLLAAGCKKTIDDATLTQNVQKALAADPTISKQTLQTSVTNGVVTLTGNVTDDTASAVAAQDAAKVAGVKEVINSIQVAGIQVTPTVTSPAAPENPRPATQTERQIIATQKTLPPPAANTPPPPPKPVVRNITLPAGSAIPVRITETLESGHTETGTPFNGTVTHSVTSNGYVIIPAGSAVSGRVVEAKDAGHFKGNSLLAIQLTAVRRHGQLIQIATDTYSVEGKGRGKNTALKIGGGAAAGALLGGLFGGGKGAGIGALAGGGAGTAYQGMTRGQQVTISSETLIRFRTTAPITVQTTEAASDEEPTSGLQTR